MNDTKKYQETAALPMSPRFELMGVDLVTPMADYRFMLAGGQSLKQVGLISYLHVLCVVDAHDREVLFVCAETNPAEGPGKVHLGLFDSRGHATLGTSPLVGEPLFFLPLAFAVARDQLGISYKEHPMGEKERGYLAAIPELVDIVYKGATPDADTLRMIQIMARGIEV